ncbi:MAG: cupin domain-containing protein [Chloroflexota bacterium]|nr:cupin domain-containing protein [Chloroflexota bacterium]MDE2885400.1 cupin domain-containing protein [Chloroflexota bacterium]
MTTGSALPEVVDFWRNHAYDGWLAKQGVPVHTGYYVEDARTLERGWWSLRGCPAAVISLEGHRGIEHVHVQEIPPGATLPPFRMALEEVIYVFEGNGIANVWAEGQQKVTFEWQKHSLFRIPVNYNYELSNARGDRSAITLHVNLLPMAMGTNPSEDYFFNNPYVDLSQLYGNEAKFYSAAARPVQLSGQASFSSGARSMGYEPAAGAGALAEDGRSTGRSRMRWYGNFFPDLSVWDKLEAGGSAGRLSYRGGIFFPGSAFSTSLMVLPSRRYRAAHRHAAGVTIVGIQEAEGFVLMWPEGGDYLVAPWKEGAVFVPPYHWYHMHFNSGAVENRQLRIRAPRPGANPSADPQRMIPFAEQDPWIRQKFEEELAKRGLTSLMPEEAYTDPDFEWDEEWLKED